MLNTVDSILHKALELSPVERADVAERLLFSLDKPDSTIDELWAKEADLRVALYEKGKLKTATFEDVFAKYHS